MSGLFAFLGQRIATVAASTILREGAAGTALQNKRLRPLRTRCKMNFATADLGEYEGSYPLILLHALGAQAVCEASPGRR